MKLNFQTIGKPVLVLFLICTITSALLAGTNLLTRDRIEAQKLEDEISSRRVVMPLASEFEDKDGYVIGKEESGETVGYVFITESKGYGGTVKVMTGISVSGAVSGVTILSHSETVGLGANAAKPDFLDQFIQPVPENGTFTVVKSTSPENGEIAAVTGATISSNAVTKAVNEALVQFQKLKGGA